MIRHSRPTALGILLCVLAALFAVEAKIAWFSPAGSASAQVSFDKARPAETPKALPLRFNAPAPHTPDFACVSILLPVLVVGLASTFAIRVVPARPPVSASPGFSASLFFRPPPIQ